LIWLFIFTSLLYKSAWWYLYTDWYDHHCFFPVSRSLLA